MTKKNDDIRREILDMFVKEKISYYESIAILSELEFVMHTIAHTRKMHPKTIVDAKDASAMYG